MGSGATKQATSKQAVSFSSNARQAQPVARAAYPQAIAPSQPPPPTLSSQVQSELSQSVRPTTAAPEKEKSAFNFNTLMNREQFASIMDRLLTIYEQIGAIEKTAPAVNKKVKENYMEFLNRGINTVLLERDQLQASAMAGGWNGGVQQHGSARLEELEKQMKQYIEDRNKCVADIEQLQERLQHLQRLQNEQSSLWQQLFNGEEYGSVTEYFFVERLRNLGLRHQVAAMAHYLWNTAHHFAFHAQKYMNEALSLWRKIVEQQGDTQQLALKTQESLAKTILQIKSLRLYLSEYNIPYCDTQQLQYLEQAYQFVLTDAQDPSRFAIVSSFYENVFGRCTALLSWTVAVMTEQIRPDLDSIANEIRDDRKQLNNERLKLLQAMMDSTFEKDAPLQQKFEAYKTCVEIHTQTEADAIAAMMADTAIGTSSDLQAAGMGTTAVAASGTGTTWDAGTQVAPSAQSVAVYAAPDAGLGAATAAGVGVGVGAGVGVGVGVGVGMGTANASVGADTREVAVSGSAEAVALPSRTEIFSKIDKLWKQHDEGANDLQQLTQASRAKTAAELQAKLQARRLNNQSTR